MTKEKNNGRDTTGALMIPGFLPAAFYSGDQLLTHYERGMTYGDLMYAAVGAAAGI